MMIDTPHYESKVVANLAKLISEATGKDATKSKLIEDVCMQGFRGNQSLEYYRGLFSAYVNTYSLMQESDASEGLKKSVALVIGFVAKKLQEKEKEKRFPPEDALKEFDDKYPLTSEEQNLLFAIFQRLLGRKPTELKEGADCPSCDGQIGGKKYCLACGYGL